MKEIIMHKTSKASPGTILKRHHRRLKSNVSLKEFARRIAEFTMAGDPGSHTATCAAAWLDSK
jgi:hypothetical protein